MLRRRNGLALIISLMLVCTMLLSACSKKDSTTEPAATPIATDAAKPEATEAATPIAITDPVADLKPVELTYYYMSGPQKDIELVQTEMNKILKAKINATIKLMGIDWAAYEQKMNVMMGAGEKYDLVFTAPWFNNYFQNVAKGALLPLDDLLKQYAPQLLASIPSAVWDATRVNGKIYGSINWQIVAMPYGTQVEKKNIAKYNINLDAIQKYEDLEPYLAAWKESYPPLSYAKDGPDSFTSQPPYFNMDSVGDDTSVGWVKLDDPAMTIVNQYASPEFTQYVKLMRKWYQAGYFPKDAAIRTAAQNGAESKAGKNVLFPLALPVKPGGEAEAKAASNIDVVLKPLSKAIITTNRAIATMTGISATSENPERAMMFLELINTDKDLYNLLANGIEGTHYKKVSDNVIEKVKDNNGYNPTTDWVFGNQFNAYYTTPDSVGNWEKTIELNKNASVSPILGFTFNAEPIKTELAQTTSVWQQYKDALLTGTADPDKILPEFLEKLNKAGADKVIAEKQKQIDAWKASK